MSFRFKGFELLREGSSAPDKKFSLFSLVCLQLPLIAFVQLANRRKVVHQGSCEAKTGPRSPRFSFFSVTEFRKVSKARATAENDCDINTR